MPTSLVACEDSVTTGLVQRIPAFGVPHPLHAPITASNTEADARIIVRVIGLDDGLTRWAVVGPAGAAEIHVPALPEEIDESAILMDGALSGRVQLCSEFEGRRCSRSALSRVFDFAP